MLRTVGTLWLRAGSRSLSWAMRSKLIAGSTSWLSSATSCWSGRRACLAPRRSAIQAGILESTDQTPGCQGSSRLGPESGCHGSSPLITVSGCQFALSVVTASGCQASLVPPRIARCGAGASGLARAVRSDAKTGLIGCRPLVLGPRFSVRFAAFPLINSENISEIKSARISHMCWSLSPSTMGFQRRSSRPDIRIDCIL